MIRKTVTLLKFACVVVLFAGISPVHASDDFTYWPGAGYDPAVPTMHEVLGYTPDERIAWSHDVRRYFEALAAFAPERLVLVDYGRSWEGRPLFYAVLSAAENVANREQVQAGMQALRDPRVTSRAAALEIISTQPAVTWLAYSVHGNEISPSEAGMLTAYHLLAARGDPRVPEIMQNTVVVINPVQNPDGRDRFIHRFETALGLEPSADRISAEHNEPWPSGRTNHYLFDLNRDWFMRTQPETIGHADEVLKWLPVAFVDLHEMGSDSTYFFAPEAHPYNPHLAEDQKTNLSLFGRTNAGWFDRFGIDYFTREVYDAFYPGYGASWPAYFGSIAMTFEQASARGLVFRQYDGRELHFRETIRNQFVASLGTAETVAKHRQKLLTDFYEYQVSAIAEGRQESVRSYLIPTQADQPGADKLAGLLVQNGIEVGQAQAAFKACGQQYQAGSYIVDLAQPAKRHIRTLMDARVPLDQPFLDEQEARRARNLPDQIYDVTAWSLPLMMNVAVQTCSRVPSVQTQPRNSELVIAADVQEADSSVAYLVPWGTRPAVQVLARALRAGIKVKSSDLAFTHAGREYPGGTLIIDVADNDAQLAEQLAQLAAATGAEIVGVNDSWVTDGPSFGSARVVRHTPPRVAIAWDTPTSQYVAGNTRFVVERQFDYPVTAIRTQHLGSSRLSGYDVLILPSGNYRAALSDAAVSRLKRWVDDGGVLIGIHSAMRFLADPKVDLLAVRREQLVLDEAIEASATAEEDQATVPGQLLDETSYKHAITATPDGPDSVAGVLVKAEVENLHWLGAGVAPQLNVLVRGADIYTPIRINDGVNVAHFAAAEELLNSGYLWEENRQQLAFKPFTVVQRRGRGYVIGFTQDPNVRAYLDGLNVLFMNAIFRGAAHASASR